FKHRKGGLYDRIVNGKQFDDARKTSWPRIMSTEQIEALDVYWYETYNNLVQDIPAYTLSQNTTCQHYQQLIKTGPAFSVMINLCC
ncbi:MAG: hypothetical protein PF450_16305, partial [Bacteroidales bacterium]|nr:hypothetical protein [Bacteroidales bacterium]